MILRPNDKPDERWVIMTEQPRVAAGSLQFLEIPAGMLDDSMNFAGSAARQIAEEVGLNIKWKELKNMTELATQGRKVPEKLSNAMYPSPGGCDEFISIFCGKRNGLDCRLRTSEISCKETLATEQRKRRSL